MADETTNTTDLQTETETETEYERATLYFQANTKRKFERFLKRQELENTVVEESDKRQEHEAIIRVAMNHPEEFVEELENLTK